MSGRNEIAVVVKQIYSVFQSKEFVSFVHTAKGEVAGQFWNPDLVSFFLNKSSPFELDPDCRYVLNKHPNKFFYVGYFLTAVHCDQADRLQAGSERL